MPKYTDQWYVTEGVTSSVYEQKPGADGDDPDAKEFQGHVLLADLDDASDPQDALDRLPPRGFRAVLESSPGSYHGVQTTVRDRDATANLLDACGDDPLHVQSGKDRRRWVLRWRPKTDAVTWQDAKPAPRLVAYDWQPCQRVQSDGHIRYVASLARDRGAWLSIMAVRDLLDDRDLLTGDGIVSEQYLAMKPDSVMRSD